MIPITGFGWFAIKEVRPGRGGGRGPQSPVWVCMPLWCAILGVRATWVCLVTGHCCCGFLWLSLFYSLKFRASLDHQV